MSKGSSLTGQITYFGNYDFECAAAQTGIMMHTVKPILSRSLSLSLALSLWRHSLYASTTRLTMARHLSLSFVSSHSWSVVFLVHVWSSLMLIFSRSFRICRRVLVFLLDVSLFVDILSGLNVLLGYQSEGFPSQFRRQLYHLLPDERVIPYALRTHNRRAIPNSRTNRYKNC